MSAPYRFDRYRNGRLMAEGIKVTKENCLKDAIKVAARLADPGDVLVYDARAALAARDKRVREEALREAAEQVNRNLGKPAHHAHAAVLALIEKDKSDG